MAIDLSTPEGRSNYLKDSLSDLINGVDSTYGTLIFDELLKRIETDLSDQAVVEQEPQSEGRQLVMVMSPTKKKN